MEYGLIGEKISHSYSNDIHESLGHYSYEICDLSQDAFSTFMSEKNFKAINVTIPYKEKVIPYLDYISPDASQMHSVNIVVNKDSKLYGYNSDITGIIETFKHYKIDVKGKIVLVLGTGGASHTVAYTLNKLEAKKVITVSREEGKGDITYDKVNLYYNDVDVIVNATPNGMYHREYKRLVELDKFSKLEVVFDLIYNPLKTPLMLEAEELKIKAVGGMYMLISQAVDAMHHFKGIDVSKEEVDKYFSKIVKDKLNIVLIGMPTSGKTTIGDRLSKILNKDYVDTDTYISLKNDIVIPSYIEEKGEENFRVLETESIKEIKDFRSTIISTGGGVITKDINMKYLKENSIIFFIDRPLELLYPSNDRPLSSDNSSLKKKYDERIELYRKYADYIIKNDKDIDDVVKMIVRIFKNESTCC